MFSDSILRLSFFNDIQSILSERQQREHSRLSSARLEALLKWLPSVGEFAAPILTIGNVDLSELTVSSSGTKYTLVLQSLRELTSRASRPIIVILQEVGVHSEQQDNPSPRVTLPETRKGFTAIYFPGLVNEFPVDLPPYDIFPIVIGILTGNRSHSDSIFTEFPQNEVPLPLEFEVPGETRATPPSRDVLPGELRSS